MSEAACIKHMKIYFEIQRIASIEPLARQCCLFQIVDCDLSSLCTEFNGGVTDHELSRFRVIVTKQEVMPHAMAIGAAVGKQPAKLVQSTVITMSQFIASAGVLR